MTKINSLLFIPPGINLHENDAELSGFLNKTKVELAERWETEEGKDILRIWKENHYSRDSLDSLVGRYYGQTDLRGVDLSNLDLSQSDLNHIDFFSSNFSNTNLSQTDLQGSWLSECNIKGAEFNWSKMDGVILDSTKFNHATHFYGVDLSKINFTLAILLQDLIVDQQRIATIESSNPNLAFFLRWSCDYGRSISLFFLWTFAIILFYSLLYLVPGITNVASFLDSIYFSVITFTTLGYGDILPLSDIGKLIVISEVFLGFVMLGLLVAIISRKVVGR